MQADLECVAIGRLRYFF